MAAVEATLAGGGDIAGVNGMTMNFGAQERGSEYGRCRRRRRQRFASSGRGGLRRAGIGLDGEQAWRKVGITPMIGQNDLPGEVFTLDDARRSTRSPWTTAWGCFRCGR